jgi:hypothetical protein
MSRQHQLLLSHRHTQPSASMDNRQLLPLPSAGNRVTQSYVVGRGLIAIVRRQPCTQVHCPEMGPFTLLGVGQVEQVNLSPLI